jgi:hypothetical protein
MIQPSPLAGDRPFRDTAVFFGKWLAILFGLAAAAQISWNMFAPDMFGADPIRMKQALGLIVFAGIASLILRFAAGLRRQD